MSSLYTRGARVFLGVLGLSSLALEIIVLINEGVFNAPNFFSFFTVLSNLFAGIFLIYFGFTDSFSRKAQIIRGAITLYMLMTGVIFAALLAGLDNVRLTAVPWNNLVLHYIMPIVVVGDWFIHPPKKSLPTKAVTAWIVFPILYVLYTLLRGAFVSWYPYPFLNPSLSSYMQVVVVSLFISIFVLIAAYGLRFYTVVRSKR